MPISWESKRSLLSDKPYNQTMGEIAWIEPYNILWNDKSCDIHSSQLDLRVLKSSTVTTFKIANKGHLFGNWNLTDAYATKAVDSILGLDQ